jgi:hypothetical protein
MDRAKAYSWLLTIVIGVAITTAVRELATLIATPGGSSTSLISASLVRFAIFLLLSIRWTMGVLWYLDKAYLSKSLEVLPTAYFFDFFVLLINFLVFVPLALTITTPRTPASPLAGWLNTHLTGGREVSTFIWIFALLLTYDSLWFALKLLWRGFAGGEGPRRVHLFWASLNFLTFLLCAIVFLFYGWTGKDLESAEVPILYIVLAASVLDLWGTVMEDSPLSRWLSP